MQILRPHSTFKGIPVSPGIIIGRAYLLDKKKVRPLERIIDADMVESELERFHRALAETRTQLEAIKSHYERNNIGDYSYLVDVHLLMLDDQMIVRETEKLVKESLHSADWALYLVIKKIKEVFAGLNDEYFRDRQSDIEHLGERVMANLMGQRLKRLEDVKEDVVIVAHDLSPMDTAQLDVHRVKGFVTDLGGRTSHTAILARSLNIPAVAGLETFSDVANGGDIIIIDGIRGHVVLNPSDEELEIYKNRRARWSEYLDELETFAGLPASTQDGEAVMVRANIELLDELENIDRYGAEGVGLYRTEFLYLNKERLPTSDEHYETYVKVAQAVSPDWLTIRTLDLGGDKVAHTVPLAEETNPALGLRSIRLCLKEREIFRDQLKGILRAGVMGNVRVMFPMISGVGELEESMKILRQAEADLESEGVEHAKDITIGAMIEVPSAVLMAREIAKRVDFLSIGTNDLIQYALAIDRVNEHVAYLYEPLHPAVLRLIKMVVEAGGEFGVPVSVCGEMAGDEFYTLVLIGLGVKELSMHAASIPRVKRVISRATMAEARKIADHALKMETASQVHEFIETYLRQKYPGLLDPLS